MHVPVFDIAQVLGYVLNFCVRRVLRPRHIFWETGAGFEAGAPRHWNQLKGNEYHELLHQ